jgi:hypothetical protein
MADEPLRLMVSMDLCPAPAPLSCGAARAASWRPPPPGPLEVPSALPPLEFNPEIRRRTRMVAAGIFPHSLSPSGGSRARCAICTQGRRSAAWIRHRWGRIRHSPYLDRWRQDGWGQGESPDGNAYWRRFLLECVHPVLYSSFLGGKPCLSQPEPAALPRAPGSRQSL